MVTRPVRSSRKTTVNLVDLRSQTTGSAVGNGHRREGEASLLGVWANQLSFLSRGPPSPVVGS